jgi:hypothetical protein
VQSGRRGGRIVLPRLTRHRQLDEEIGRSQRFEPAADHDTAELERATAAGERERPAMVIS